MIRRAARARCLATAPGEGIRRARLGQDIQLHTLAYGKRLDHRRVPLSFQPAGHGLGAAQVCPDYRGEVWVASGDYKVEPDGSGAPFEPVRGHGCITESTFGLPIYRSQAQVLASIHGGWRGWPAKAYSSLTDEEMRRSTRSSARPRRTRSVRCAASPPA